MSLDNDAVGVLAARLDAASHVRLGRSLAVFPVFAGDCGGCALEWAMLRGAAHGLAQHGIAVLDDPAGADVLLVMGAMTHSLVSATRLALAAMAPPCWVVALGDCAGDGGVFARSGAVAGGAGTAVPVDLVVPGCPPSPGAMLDGLRTVLEANC